MGGLIMKKVLATLCILVILSGSALAHNASANYDEMPKLTRTFSLPIDNISQLK